MYLFNMWFWDLTKANRANKIELEHAEQSFLFFRLGPKIQKSTLLKMLLQIFVKASEYVGNQIQIRHNQIRKSIPVRQKNFQSLLKILVCSYSVIDINLEFFNWNYPVGIFQLEKPSWIFSSQYSEFLPDVGDFNIKSVIWLRNFRIRCSENVKLRF